MLRLMLYGCAAFLLLSVPSANAQTGPRSTLQFDALDRNADGAIDRTEAAGYRERLFRTIDLEGKGVIVLEEWLAATKTQLGTPDGNRIEEQFRAADLDGDGRLRLEEMMQAGEARFQYLDKNSDGRIARDEYHTGGL